ncbi:MAG: response regulator [Deltaproteobacteria bacterium]|nr:response regulator [Deltaproteobacteria bacterium]
MDEAKKKILVVDDEEGINILYKEELEDEGYEVLIARNGQEAVDFFTSTPLDLIVMDIKMPVMNGIEALRQIKELKPDFPVILCSAYGVYKQDFRSWACDEYVIKSSDLTELKEAIRKHLRINN